MEIFKTLADNALANINNLCTHIIRSSYKVFSIRWKIQSIYSIYKQKSSVNILECVEFQPQCIVLLLNTSLKDEASKIFTVLSSEATANSLESGENLKLIA